MYQVFKFASYETYREFVIDQCGDGPKKWKIISTESFKGFIILTVYKDKIMSL